MRKIYRVELFNTETGESIFPIGEYTDEAKAKEKQQQAIKRISSHEECRIIEETIDDEQTIGVGYFKRGIARRAIHACKPIKDDPEKLETVQ